MTMDLLSKGKYVHKFGGVYTLLYTDTMIHGETWRFYIMPVNARIGMSGIWVVLLDL